MSGPPRIWLLLGHRRGDNNQVLALGEALGLPFETRTMTYKWLARLRMKLFRTDVGHLKPSARRWLEAPWPDLVIGIGRRTVPIARWIKEQSGGRTKLVRLGHPRAPNEWFDLVVTTRQYPVPPGENVLTLPLAMNRFRNSPEPTEAEREWLNALPRPHLLLSLGGPSAMWRLDNAALHLAAAKLVKRAEGNNGTLIVVGSPRTPADAWAVIQTAISESKRAAIVAKNEVRYPVLLADADEHHVTADSVSMISEAVMTGMPVGLITVEPDSRGRRRIRGRPPEVTKIRDPRRFWSDVQARGLVGTVDEPKSGEFEDPVETAVAAVRTRLSSLFE
ncbi:MAG TPA: ELM1/GtrOC1 family putative glycosyltransferase [Sphingomicrobium sp.]